VSAAAGPTGARRQLDALARAQPEAGPWLALIEATLDETENPAWERAAGAAALGADRTTAGPLLAGTTVPLDRTAADRWVRRLLALAGEAGPATASLRRAAGSGGLDPLALLEAAINRDGQRLGALATEAGTDPDALGAVAHLAAVPLLQALRRRFGGAVGSAWDQGSCPVCGAWPTLAESRGLERSRRLRCGRCGADWGFPAFRCPYCATTDHAKLGLLVPEGNAEARRVDTCDVCRGYLKLVATLRAWAGDEVALADLSTVDLDLAALDHGYARPETIAGPLDLRIVAASSGGA